MPRPVLLEAYSPSSLLEARDVVVLLVLEVFFPSCDPLEPEAVEETSPDEAGAEERVSPLPLRSRLYSARVTSCGFANSAEI